MPASPTTQDLIAAAAAALQHAAGVCLDRAADDVFSPWHALAGQLELTASGLDPTALADRSQPPGSTGDLAALIASAIALLNQVPGLDGPEDLSLWRWHCHQLATLAGQLGQR